MSENGQKPTNGRNGTWWKVVGALAALVLGSGGAAGGVTSITADARLAVLERIARDQEKAIDNMNIQLSTISNLLAGVPPRIEELQRKADDALVRVDKVAIDAREARRDMRTDIMERINDLARDIDTIERRISRSPSSTTPVGPVRPPIVDGDVSADMWPFGAPGATEGLRR